MSMESPMRDLLIAALLSGKGNLAELRAAAYAEQSHPTAVAQADVPAKNAVWQRLAEIHNASAPDAWAVIRDRWNQAASELTSAIGIVDPDTDAVEITKADDETRRAWWTSEEKSAELTCLLAPLTSAAFLLGVRQAETDEAMVALTVDPRSADRIDVWRAWALPAGTSRGGKWAALVKAGCALRAHPDPANLVPYGQTEPAPPNPPINPRREPTRGRVVIQ
jgi:hypothetical protein